MKKIISVILVISMLLTFGAMAAGAAYEGQSRIVYGADIDDDERSTVCDMMGVEKGSVPELTVSISEVRQYLEGIVSDSKIGTHSISSVYIKFLKEGSGLSVSVSNIEWVTEDIYRNALMTAGIYDADVRIAAPFGVSGTSALTGIYKAYEDITGTSLNENAKETAVEELVITSELADAVGEVDATQVVNELKKILNQTASMSDEELREEILRIADQCNISLSDEHIQQLIRLVRKLEKLDTSVLVEKVEELKGFVQSLAKSGSAISSFFASVGSFFSKIGSWISGLFHK